MRKIASVEARTVIIPTKHPTAFSTRKVTERHYMLVRVRDTDGAQGIGFCYVGNAGGVIASTAVRSLLAPIVVGDDPTRVRGLWEDLYAHALLHGRTGSVMRAISALDIAIWDLNARSLDLPLWQHLGHVTALTVPAYASGGYYLPGKGPAELADEARRYLDLGFEAVKIKVGRIAPAADAERIAEVRQAIGPDTLLMLDANNAWQDTPSALQALRKWEAYDPYWIEEPFGPDDIDNHARLAQSTPITVATGEIEAGRWRHKALLDGGAAAILQTDAAVCGGITEFQRIAALADSYGVAMCPHWFHDLHVHLVASIANAQFVEFFPDDAVLNFRRLLTQQLSIAEGGRLRLPDGPGLGFDLDAEAVEKYALDDWA